MSEKDGEIAENSPRSNNNPNQVGFGSRNKVKKEEVKEEIIAPAVPSASLKTSIHHVKDEIPGQVGKTISKSDPIIPVDNVRKSSGVDIYFTFEEFQKVNWRHLNRVFNREIAGQHLSDPELLLLAEWHRQLKKMIQDKGQKYAILTRLLQVDIDAIEVQISERGLVVSNRVSLNEMSKNHLEKGKENGKEEKEEKASVSDSDQEGGSESDRGEQPVDDQHGD